MISRYFKYLSDNMFILGPRGTGKSTWLKNELKEALIINLLDDATFRKHLADPGYLKQIVSGTRSQYQIYVIDEIQKAPKILDTIHDLIESDPSIHFIMTGSSARKLKRSGVNLLAGRALLTTFHPFMASELKEKFDLNDALQNGLIPLIFQSKNPKSKILSYINLYLKEEVQSEALVRNIGDFAKFLEIMTFSHGSVLNLLNIARECGISRKITENYLSILEDLLIAYTLPVFTKKSQRMVVSHPKFYFFDSGIYFHLRPKGPLDAPSEVMGSALEGLVFQHLKAWSEYSGKKTDIFYWRTKSGVEVDFIGYSEDLFFAIEVKNGKMIHPSDLKGLKSFREDYPTAKLLLLYRGEDRIIKDEILCVPVEQFLLQLIPDVFPKF